MKHALLVIAVITLLMLFAVSEKFQNLTNVYKFNPGECETCEECKDDERRQCFLSNGYPGKCVMYGRCCSQFMNYTPSGDISLPSKFCGPSPVSSRDCKRWCKCKGDPTRKCKYECKSWFHPYFRN